MFFGVKDLCVNYGKLEVLKGVSLEVPEGKISVLLGANGSGKSTLFRAVTGLVPPGEWSQLIKAAILVFIIGSTLVAVAWSAYFSYIIRGTVEKTLSR